MRRFWDKVDKSGDCWLWMAGLGSDGHGQFWFEGRTINAHRYAFGLERIPPGMLVHHECGARACVRPEHLRLVSPSEHPVIHGAQITHCPQGHSYSEANTYLYIHRSGVRNRMCKTCQRERTRARRAA